MKKLISLLFLLTTILNVFALKPEEISSETEKAISGNSFSQYRLAWHYFRNDNYPETMKWCEKLLSNNNATEKEKGECCYMAGIICVNGGPGVIVSRDKGIAHFKKGVEYKNSDCADCMAQLFEKNNKYQDLAKAFIWYEKCAELGDYKAAWLVAKQYEDNSGISYHSSVTFPEVSTDYAKAIRNYEFYLDNMPKYRPNPSNQYQYLDKIDPVTSIKVADAYFEGAQNVVKDYGKAVKYYELCINGIDENIKLINDECMASDYKISEALWRLASCYRFGRGVGKNELKARKLIKRSADMGYQKAIDFMNR